MCTRKNIFVSYKHKEPDSKLAHEFVTALNDSGHKTFVDSGIRWGQNWVAQIEIALKACDFLLLLLSKEAAKSELVIEEVAIARQLAKQQDGRPTILPLRVNFPFTKPLPYNLSAYLRSVQQETWSGDSDTNRIKELLLRVVGSKSIAKEWRTEDQLVRPPIADPESATVGGALSFDSPYYITRDIDEEVMNALRRTRQVISIKGARQTGKTSLLIRAREFFRHFEPHQCMHASAIVDLQLIEDKNFESLIQVWRAISDEIALDLNIDNWIDSSDRECSNYRQLLDRFLDRYIFNDNYDRLIIFLDEVDRLFDYPIKNSFFGSVRGLFNKGATDSSWRNVAWVLSSSTEPEFYIEDNYQSPFNIGHRVKQNPFTAKQTNELAIRYGLNPDDRIVEKVFEFAGGRPFITNKCFYLLTIGKPKREVFHPHTFASHLHRYLLHFRIVPDLSRAMKDIVQGRGFSTKNNLVSEKLLSTGLVVRDDGGILVPAGTLYRDFFSQEL